MTPLGTLVRGVLALEPGAPAIEFEHRWWTWGELSRIVEGLDGAFEAAGLGAGARIGSLMRNHVLVAGLAIELVVSDRCMVTLNPGMPDDRLGSEIRNVKPPALVGLERDWERPAVREAAGSVGCLGVMLCDDPERPVRLVPGLEIVRGTDLNREAPGIVIEMLTSGTTGPPKRIPLKATSFSRGILEAGVFDGRAVDDPPRLRSGVQVLNTPFAHIGGLFGLFNCLSAGRRSSLLERFTVESWTDAVRRHRPKAAGAPPSALRMILDADVPKEDLASLVVFRVSTAPLEPELADEFYERYGIPVLQNYGATEFAGGVAGWTLADFKAHHQDKRGSVGRLNPGVEGRIVNPDTGEVLAHGQEGLLELRAPQLLDGKTWVRTMDVCVLDADDFLWIKRRYDNAIVRGGFKVMPDDVVRSLEQHPAIREAAVVGVRDDRLGQVPVAAFRVRSGASAPSEAELKEFLRTRLMPYQVPARFLAVEDFPRTPSMKVSQPDLKALFDAAPS
ncbi:MAG: long-chain fatty acid--CoA ligase [Caulobacteraceae bacterium]|nr:long-chain fatty acid--CoA ligase [Caulobacteraceae bacterium]